MESPLSKRFEKGGVVSMSTERLAEEVTEFWIAKGPQISMDLKIREPTIPSVEPTRALAIRSEN